MNESPFLTKEEIRLLTGRKFASAQFKVLNREGIPATRDGDGRPVVNRKIYEQTQLGAKPRPTRKKPNLGALK